MVKLRPCVAFALLMSCGDAQVVVAPDDGSSRAASGPAIAAVAHTQEDATFVLHKVEDRIGEERVRVQPGPSAKVRSTFHFSDRGSQVSMASTLAFGPDGLPREFELWGKTSSVTEVDVDVQIHDGEVEVRDGASSRTVPAPSLYFTAAGYGPTGVKEALVQVWHRSGRPASIPLFPSGSAELRRRGDDVFELGGESITLERLTLAGLEWGPEVVWIDQQQRLIAAVTNDGGFNHLEVVREGFEPLLEQFVRRAGVDAMAVLDERAPAPIHAGRFVIVHARVIDGIGSGPIDDAVIVIDDGKIVSVGPSTESSGGVPGGLPILDARGLTVLPGLWDMHAHFEQPEWGPVYLAAGVTTVRDVGNSLAYLAGLRDGELVPRILCAGLVDGDDGDAIGKRIVRSVADIEPLVTEIAAAGCLQIKIYSSVAPELVGPLAKEAHRQGLTVTGHLPDGMTMDEAIDAGFDMFNHIDAVLLALVPEGAPMSTPVDLDSKAARSIYARLTKRDIVVDPTLALIELMVLGTSNEPGAAKVAPELARLIASVALPPGLSAAELGEREAILDYLVAIVGALHRAGVDVVAGTDASVPGHSLHRELELYVEAGMSPIEAIRSATSVPARVMGLDHEVGSIAPGMRADLILVAGDPSTDISDLRKTTMVVTRGRVYETATLWSLVGFEP